MTLDAINSVNSTNNINNQNINQNNVYIPSMNTNNSDTFISQNKKKVAAFAGITAIAAAIIYLVKTGKIDTIKDLFNKNKGNIQNEVESTQNVIKKAIDKTKSIQEEAAKRTSAARAEELAKAANDAKLTKNFANKSAEESAQTFIHKFEIEDEAAKRIQDAKDAIRKADVTQTAYKASAEKNLANKSAKKSAEVIEDAILSKENPEIHKEVIRRAEKKASAARKIDITQAAYKASAEKNLANKSAKKSAAIIEENLRSQEKAIREAEQKAHIEAIQKEALKRTEAIRKADITQTAYKASAEKNLANKSAKKSAAIIEENLRNQEKAHAEEIQKEALKRVQDAKDAIRKADITQTAYNASAEKNLANKSAKKSAAIIEGNLRAKEKAIQEEVIRRSKLEHDAAKKADFTQRKFKNAIEGKWANKSAEESMQTFLENDKAELAFIPETFEDRLMKKAVDMEGEKLYGEVSRRRAEIAKEAEKQADLYSKRSKPERLAKKYADRKAAKLAAKEAELAKLSPDELEWLKKAQQTRTEQNMIAANYAKLTMRGHALEWTKDGAIVNKSAKDSAEFFMRPEVERERMALLEAQMDKKIAALTSKNADQTKLTGIEQVAGGLKAKSKFEDKARAAAKTVQEEAVASKKPAKTESDLDALLENVGIVSKKEAPQLQKAKTAQQIASEEGENYLDNLLKDSLAKASDKKAAEAQKIVDAANSEKEFYQNMAKSLKTAIDKIKFQNEHPEEYRRMKELGVKLF